MQSMLAGKIAKMGEFSDVLNQKSLMEELRATHWDLGLFELLDYGGYRKSEEDAISFQERGISAVLYEAGVKNIIGDVSVVLPDRVASVLGLPQAWSYVPGHPPFPPPKINSSPPEFLPGRR